MKIKHENGMVTFVMRAGKDLVRSRMTIGSAQGVVNKGENVIEKDNQIIVDDTYFFPTVAKPRKKQKEGAK